MSLTQNQFSQSPIQGMLDLRMNTGTVSAEIDSSEAGTLLAGQPVKLVDSVGGIPKVVACSADSDVVFGYIAYDIKSQSFKALDKIEVCSMLAGNVMYLPASAAIARGARVKNSQVASGTPGSVATVTSGAPIVGYAYDKAVNVGDLIRVVLELPSYFVG